MTAELWSTLLSVMGSLAGAFLAVLASNKLVDWRLKQLEAKVDKHNNVIERVYKIEAAITDIRGDISELRKYHPIKPS